MQEQLAQQNLSGPVYSLQGRYGSERSHVGGVGLGYRRESKLTRGCSTYSGVNLRRKGGRMAAF